MVLEELDPQLARRMENSGRLKRLGVYNFEMDLNGSPSEPIPGALFSKHYHHLAIEHSPNRTRYFKVLYREHTIYDTQEERDVTKSVSARLVFYRKKR